MILFKRVGESFRHIEDREWVLLFLETLGVLVGILLAFELQEWGQRRSEAAKHHQLMERLFEESEMDVTAVRRIRDVSHQYVEAEKKLAVELSQDRCPMQSDWDEVNTVGLLPAVGAPTSVYQELTAAGGLASVELQSVRAALEQFHQSLDWTQRQVNYFRDSRIEVLSPSDARVRVRFDPTRHEPEVWTFDRRTLCKDQAFRNRFAAATRHHVVYTRYIEDLTEDALKMCASLGASLNRSCVPRAGGPFGTSVAPLNASDAAIARSASSEVRTELARN
jgi:hypothetical protein